MIEDSKQYVLQLTAEDIQIIKSALLFYSYEFINAEYNSENVTRNKNICQKIISNFPDIKSKDVYILKSKNGSSILEELSEFTTADGDLLNEVKEVLKNNPELLDHDYKIVSV